MIDQSGHKELDQPLSRQEILQKFSQAPAYPMNQIIKFLIKIIANNDVSFLEVTINFAAKYFEPVFKFWWKYNYEMRQAIHSFMEVTYQKVNLVELEWIKLQFQALKKIYKRASRREVVLKEQQKQKQTVDVRNTDQNIIKLIDKLTKKQLKEHEKTLLVEQKIQNQQIIVDPNTKLGSDHLYSDIPILRQIYFKTYLKFKCKYLKKMKNLTNQLSTQIIKQNHKDNSQQEQKNKQYSAAIEHQLLRRLQERAINSRDCFSCLKYIYRDQDLTFPACYQSVIFFQNMRLKDQQDIILKQIVALLNGRGGVILMGCRSIKQRLLPIIDQIPEFTKQHSENRINDYMKLIRPAITNKQQILMDYIPIAQNVRDNVQLCEPEWLKGNYVLRIVVTPKQPHSTYYYTTNQIQHFYSHQKESNKIHQLKKQEIYVFMKERFNLFNPSELDKQANLRDKGLKVPICSVYHTDDCKKPQQGVAHYQGSQYYRPTEEESLKITNPLLIGKGSYKNVSLLISEDNVVQDIKTLFKAQAKVQTLIQYAFKQQSFPLSTMTRIVWHNCKFQKLMTAIKSPSATDLKLKNNKKNILLISTLNTLKIEADIDLEQLKNVLSTISSQTMQKIQMKLINGCRYMKCGTAITAIYLYFYLNKKFKIKGKFEKCPSGSQVNKKDIKGNQKNKVCDNANKHKNKNKQYSREEEDERRKNQKRKKQPMKQQYQNQNNDNYNYDGQKSDNYNQPYLNQSYNNYDQAQMSNNMNMNNSVDQSMNSTMNSTSAQPNNQIIRTFVGQNGHYYYEYSNGYTLACNQQNIAIGWMLTSQFYLFASNQQVYQIS